MTPSDLTNKILESYEFGEFDWVHICTKRTVLYDYDNKEHRPVYEYIIMIDCPQCKYTGQFPTWDRLVKYVNENILVPRTADELLARNGG